MLISIGTREYLEEPRKFNDVIAEMGGGMPRSIDSFEESVNRRSREIAVLLGGDPDDAPTLDAIANRGAYIVPSECPDMSSPSGWLLPDGRYYGCGSMEHIGLAASLLADMPGADHEQSAESLGWVKISRGVGGLHIVCEKRVRQRQLDKIWDYAQFHNRDYEEIIRDLDT